MPGQASPARLQLVLDETARLPLRVLLATGPLSPEALIIPPNAAVVDYVPHVCLPGLGADQGIIARRVEALGVSKALPAQAKVDELRSAVEQVMAVPAYRMAAGRLAQLIGQEDGAANSVAALEACIASSS